MPSRPTSRPPGMRPSAPAAGPAAARPRLGARSRAIRRILLAALVGLSLLLLDRSGLLERWLGQTRMSGLNWTNDYAMVEYLRPLVVRRGLTRDDPNCLLFIINGNDPPAASRFEVMEKHSGACPGPRGQLPKLFTIRVDRVGHALATDAGSPGLFHPLP